VRVAQRKTGGTIHKHGYAFSKLEEEKDLLGITTTRQKREKEKSLGTSAGTHSYGSQ